MDRAEREKWYARNGARIGVAAEKMEKYYREELENWKDMGAPLEYPDKIEIFYKYAYGGQSRFFRELRENRRLYGSKCPKCGKVFCPPRQDCNRCYEKMEWIPLSGEGTVVTCCSVHFSNSSFIKKVPFICALIRLEGTDFLMISNVEMDDISQAKPGMRVRAMFREERDGAITDFYFEPMA
jgi:uncharacterized OB-fold protein